MSTTTTDVRLADPLELGRGAPLPNRLVKSALSEALAERSGAPSAELVRLYERWAVEGGHGLIVTGNVMVDRRQRSEPGNVLVEDDRDLDALRRWASAARAGGARVWTQVNHPGRQALQLLTGHRPVAPSAVRPPIPGAPVPRALDASEIEDLVARFATTAGVAKAAGFDGVQLHGAHGYLISQFLSPDANRRDDAWGGDAERRMRFVLEVLRAVRAAVGEDFPVGIKLNSADFQRGGFDEAESMAVVDRLWAEGIDLVEVSGGTYGAPAMVGQAARASTVAREAYFQEYAEEVRRRTPGLPLVLTGGFRSATAMQGALDDGACDLVGVGRSACLDPDVGAALLAGTRDHAPVGDRRVGARRLLGRVVDVRQLDGVVDLQWHTDQLHRMGAGLDPDPGRAWWRPLIGTVRRGGATALTRRRG